MEYENRRGKQFAEENIEEIEVDPVTAFVSVQDTEKMTMRLE